MKKNILLFAAFLLLCFSTLMAQYPGGGGGQGGGKGQGQGMPGMAAKLAIGHVYGKIVDSKTKKGVEFASVAIYTLKTDSLVGGQLTETNGDFSLDNLSFGGYKLKISYIGYTTLEKNVIVTPNTVDQDIGNVAITEDGKILKEVDITAEKSTIELKPDRKVFNVDKDLSARGGTGVDVMKNIPGVSTDADGNVTLRNNTPIVYVDGKPTTLTLEQIPADQIDRVEVITNPSAKFEAAATGGIINVVLKKNQKPGYNGIITMSLGTNTQYNGMALINVREKKFGFMLSYNINGSTNLTKGYTDRTNYSNGEISGHFRQDDNVTSKRLFQVGRVGFDYYVNNRNTISLSENMTFGQFSTGDNQTFNTADSLGQTIHGNRVTDQTVKFRNFVTELSIRHTYPKAEKEWTLDFSYSHNRGFTNYLNTTDNYSANGSLLSNNPFSLLPSGHQLQTDDGGQHTNMINAQWDFTAPITKNMKIEFGARSNFQRQYSFQHIADLDTLNEYIPSPVLSNDYRIDNLVNAVYITFAHTVKQFSYQIGLRFEQSYYAGILLDSSAGNFSYMYPSSAGTFYNMLFPSISLSQKFGDKHELQFNVTRKINRPNFFQLSPFIFASDKFNYRIGNPQLQPEFNNKAELNYDLTIPKLTWLSSLYGTYSQQPITQYSYTVPSDTSNILYNTFENGKNSFSYGWENTFKISPVKGLDITADGNVYYTSIISDVAGEQIKNQGISWTVKGIIAYKFPLGINAQINGTYEAPRIIPQGHTLPLYFFDLSASKDIGIVTLNLSVSDVLNSKVHGTYYDTPTYIQTSTRRRDMRYARLGVTVRFGKMDASIFKSKKVKKDKDQPSGGDDMGY